MWFWIGLIVGAGLLALVSQLGKKNIQLVWYDWIISLVVLVLSAITIQHVIASSSGGETQAVSLGALVLGLPALVLGAVEWQLIARRKKG